MYNECSITSQIFCRPPTDQHLVNVFLRKQALHMHWNRHLVMASLLWQTGAWHEISWQVIGIKKFAKKWIRRHNDNLLKAQHIYSQGGCVKANDNSTVRLMTKKSANSFLPPISKSLPKRMAEFIGSMIDNLYYILPALSRLNKSEQVWTSLPSASVSVAKLQRPYRSWKMTFWVWLRKVQ